MSQQDILAACGQPSSVSQIDKNDNRLHATQYWNYQQQTTQMLPSTPGTISPTPYGSVKVNNSGNTLVVEINNNAVTSLAMNDKLVSSASCPNGGFVQVGDSSNRVVSSCGTATQVTYQYQKNSSALPPATQWTYSLQGGGSLTIQFEQGVVSAFNQ